MKRIIFSLIVILQISNVLAARKQHVLKSSRLAVADTVWVFTPDTYKPQGAKNYPLVYLLHGWNGSYHQWNNITDCQKLSDDYGFIIVCPDGLTDSWYLNSPVFKNWHYTDFFFYELVPYISEKYRVDKENIFITGLSMGGHGALYLFSLKPEMFNSAGSLSGVVDLSYSWKDYRIKELLGLNDTTPNQAIMQKYSVTGNIASIASSGKEIMVTCGNSDWFYPLNLQFKKLCDENKIAVTFIASPGGHDYGYWKSAIGFHLDFFAKKMVLKK